MNNPRYRSLIYLLLFVSIVAVMIGLSSGGAALSQTTISDLADAIRRGNVSYIEVVGTTTANVRYVGDNRITATVHLPEQASLEESLAQHDVTPEMLDGLTIEYKAPSDFGAILGILISVLPILLFIGLIYFMFRQTQGANNQALSFGKSRARMFSGDKPTVTFDDVAGIEESKEELREVVEFLKEPEKFIQLGARIPKGVLLVGQPGTGKTLLAKAVAGEAGVPFFSISGSEFVEMFVGVGASRVRDLFEQAKRHSPCIIFVDEIDAVGRHRGAGLGGSHDEREQTLNQILVEMDGFDTDTNVIIIAATNRPDILDPALMRPGRFDRRVVLDRPDLRGREAILQVHVRGKPLSNDVDLSILARATPGFVGADVENMVNEAAILAARKNKKRISQRDFEAAIERVILGPERRSHIMSDAEKRLVAYHEAGHAIAFHFLPGCDPVQKVTIIPRGIAGGVTWIMPEEDINFITATRLRDQISGALGGRAAEEITFGEVTTGAIGDLERVTKIARSMVTRYGMSERLGPMIFGQKEELVFLGREIGEQRDYSEHVAEEIDAEVREIVNQAYTSVLALLNERHAELELVAERLLEVETLTREDFLALLGEPLPVSDAGKVGVKQQQPGAASQERAASEGGDERSSALGTAATPA